MYEKHLAIAREIAATLESAIRNSSGCYTISLAGESGSGKTVTGNALTEAFGELGFKALVMGMDNYFFLPPLANDARRKSDPSWLGPHKEVNLAQLDQNLVLARKGAASIQISHIDYQTNVESTQSVDISDVKVIIVEGTYVSLLKHLDKRIFIDEDYHDTLPFRQLRNRGNEVNDPFVEGVLETEHKIIAGHKFLADFIITKTLELVITA